ncbi:hypothetical protein [Bacillus sp. MRMR6]|uniref:hypothetical protein n=1 Tax=Bacillus sp. MRMR6 TaxID=1928617 RepID=UPI0009521B47|nr:hypothetical protein [Bacillus sp. MRMR6]OLS34034.1 hypothetical protein BTR25_23050 [Bacillus sp. MRMR6]
MLVRFKLRENSAIFFEKEYPDILPIISMVKEKVAMSYLLDLEGEEAVFGRFYDYEYIIEVHTGALMESLLVTIDCVDSSLKN